MTNYNLGATYRKATIDVDNERIPLSPAFRSFEGETHFFEPREGRLSFFHVMSALESGALNEIDKTITCITATFASACVTTKVLREMLCMMNVRFTDKTFESSIKRLHRFQLINFSHFAVEGHKPASMKIITITKFGSMLAKNLGVPHRFNPIATATAEPYAVKSRAQTAHFISNYLKNQMAEAFEVRPVLIVDPDRDAIVRPSLSVTVAGEKLYAEVPRRHEGWVDDLVDKLNRYELVFEGKPAPTVIINGEDVAMNAEAAAAIRERGYSMEILYTDDLAMFGPSFKQSLYDFDGEGNKRTYQFGTEQSA